MDGEHERVLLILANELQRTVGDDVVGKTFDLLGFLSDFLKHGIDRRGPTRAKAHEIVKTKLRGKLMIAHPEVPLD